MAEYVFDVTIQSWDRDPYYVASSAPVHKLEVVASTDEEARAEAKRVMGEPEHGRYWRTWIKRGRDIRLIAAEQENRRDNA